ncbi:SPFH domain-containing protein [Hymenobacter psychrophilus]|uniref:hypothetical protein n=1 Tax=Hymenobacter psychrophilus TaxID=651662 RepID=UPI000A60DB02|nr:hypothetical protein [Hymenobacter psychrophilus]
MAKARLRHVFGSGGRLGPTHYLRPNCHLFSRHLEAKIRAKADLENARTAVATARTLKNAAELMKDDDSIRFFQYLETITKIAAKGKHTFLVGDFPALPKG